MVREDLAQQPRVDRGASRVPAGVGGHGTGLGGWVHGVVHLERPGLVVERLERIVVVADLVHHAVERLLQLDAIDSHERVGDKRGEALQVELPAHEGHLLRRAGPLQPEHDRHLLTIGGRAALGRRANQRLTVNTVSGQIRWCCLLPGVDRSRDRENQENRQSQSFHDDHLRRAGPEAGHAGVYSQPNDSLDEPRCPSPTRKGGSPGSGGGYNARLFEARAPAAIGPGSGGETEGER